MLLIALDSYVRFASSCVLVVCGRSSDQSFDKTITMSLMPGAWALAGRRLPMSWEARQRSFGSSVHPPRPGGGTDADTKGRSVSRSASFFAKSNVPGRYGVSA